jgi:hypothetical protein
MVVMQIGATACISQQVHSKHRSSAAGETKTETFAVTVTDDKGATATQNVVVTARVRLLRTVRFLQPARSIRAMSML